MEQRPLRLGDIVDDYCPRERRITNHAIVAMVGEDDPADPVHHLRRRARLQRGQVRAPKLPQERRSELYDQVLADVPQRPPPRADDVVRRRCWTPSGGDVRRGRLTRRPASAGADRRATFAPTTRTAAGDVLGWRIGR